MKKSVKGLALFPVLLVVAVSVAVGAGGMYLYMRLNSGGLGNGTDIAIQANENISPEEIPETMEMIAVTETESETIPETEPVTERGGYVVITVVGNEYLYGNQIYDLDDLLTILHRSQELPAVKLVNQKASKKAYDTIAAALQDDGISIVKSD